MVGLGVVLELGVFWVAAEGVTEAVIEANAWPER